ncbi:hypothetical protein MVES1_002875 [Malassezia vespertilionis]|uniref:Uncharacterized protein n=1 Tax=Malassezia vespertilionis TaxID=2020962 RepID=A0A2N1JAE3_9BASI|nr:uncharacterized protein MVES1_002875 [Malassezia vespertilionis]PKI83526.1 hypothetical protein MVES_002722 [Malassezia vespertilionis]WFD07509.1 hypothetical protein MVES1_002875 [Malassezia vespertilionis]
MLFRMQCLLLVLAACVALCAAKNPLATQDQKALDELSLALSKSPKLDDARKTARDQYVRTLRKYKVLFSSQTWQDLDTTMEELVFSAVQKAVNNNPADPKVYWVDTAQRTHDWFDLQVRGGRYSYDNPDCFYRTVPISSHYTYKLHGRQINGGVSDFSFSLISNPNSQNTVGAIYGKEMQINDNGTYTITINPSHSPGPNHLRSDFRAMQIFARHNVGDWSKETPDELRIELVEKPEHSKPFTNNTILRDAIENLKQSAFFYGFGALDFKTFTVPKNQLHAPEQSQILGTLTSQAQSFGHYDLQDDEALVATITKGKADYFVFPVYTVGMVTAAPRGHQVSLNDVQADQNNDGSYTFVISNKDSGVYNWLDTVGRNQGTIMVRWQGLPTDGSGKKDLHATARVVKLDKLRSTLPQETRFVSKDERQQLLQERAKQYDRLHFQ